MSLMPTGDKGQRYEVLSTGYPMDGETVMGWAESFWSAEHMAQAFRKAPGCSQTRIRDRWQQDDDVITNSEPRDRS